jgi:RND family efflux transporter MFP subunit
MVPKETQFLFDIFTQKISRGNFKESTQLFGTIIPSSHGQATVTTPQSGVLVSVHAQVGKEIKSGQTLAVVEQNIDAGTQINMQAERNNLMAEYEAAKKGLDRLEAIKDIAAKKDVDEATSRFQKAESNLALFNSRTGKTIVLKAPISGILGNFNVSAGSTVTLGQDLFTITNLSTVYVEAQVFDRDAGKIVPEATYAIEGGNDNHKTRQITLLSPAQEINTTNQSQKVLFALNNPDGEFKIGEFVNVRVFASTPSQQITLPNSAVTEINGKPVLFVKAAAEKYNVSYVLLGENNGSHTAIVKGLEESHRAVINGSYQLKMIFLNQ